MDKQTIKELKQNIKENMQKENKTDKQIKILTNNIIYSNVNKILNNRIKIKCLCVA
jgi:uncharacterized coiled-coil protein SlyX